MKIYRESTLIFCGKIHACYKRSSFIMIQIKKCIRFLKCMFSKIDDYVLTLASRPGWINRTSLTSIRRHVRFAQYIKLENSCAQWSEERIISASIRDARFKIYYTTIMVTFSLLLMFTPLGRYSLQLSSYMHSLHL